ncbi:aerobic-type carbon monoxide dehydrogenase small subunit (CoxS/CutS family) [Streptomyces umbrinus]|uniref:Aerobic-type carbon monoxide dehydrogenase small subunit (CoxS/CutS family) n=1 Tax=Streptomyces umbrinus TaxID=67370 RepID=A0ABU0SZA3_9ACTN|nr:2Fe-2S iron-sulfur cluster-binding protein [Streptomyces umbrinus]MDQ1028890.1 aerobic-type carbon monoxide dehydrogenase small subunit (CoxS/CutS family) [Streptomyces umbrinus]
MTDDQHGESGPQSGSRWDPLPQGDYDDGATAFVKLPEGGIDALLADSPLAAPGHGYVPPPITPSPGTEDGSDPAAPGSWAPQPEGGQPQAVQWPDPNALPEEHRQPAQDAFAYNPGATGQWTFDEPSQGGQSGHGDQGAPGQDVTGQWSIPVADGDLPDESGEFTTSALVEQWGGTPPATLPGGAAAPWANEPWAQQPGPEQQSPAEEAAAAHAEHGPVGPSAAEIEAAEIIDVSGEHADEIAVSVDREESMREGTMREEPGEAPAGHGPPERADEREAHSPEERTESPADAAEEPAADDSPGTPAHNDHPLASYVLRVNGVERPVTDAWIGESLLYVLRERLGLAGAKDGCSQGECGACNVQVDGRLVASCLVPAVTAAGSEVRTVEGLAADGQPSDVQRALAKCGAVQCGFCVPGMAMTVHDLLEGNPAPTELETRQALCGNLCRCSGYRGVLNAVREVVAEREAHASADSADAADSVSSADARIPHQAGPGAGGVNPSAFESPQPHERPYGQDGGQA